MRIAVLAGIFPNVSTTFILDQVVCALDAGHEVDIYGTTPSQHAVQHPEVEGHGLAARTRYLRFNHRASHPLLRVGLITWTLLSNPKLAARVRQQTQSPGRLYDSAAFFPGQRYDVIHCHFGTTALRVLPTWQAGVLQGPMLVTFHGQDVMRRPVPNYAQLFRSDAHYTANTGFLTQKALALGCPSERLIAFPMGVDPERFTVGDADATRPRVLSVGRLVEFKGFEYGLRAFAEVLRTLPTAHYDICGDGPLRSQLEALARELGIASNVHFHGSLPRQRVAELMARAWVFLLPGVTDQQGQVEAQGVVLLEAQASGVPVVASRVGGIPEVVRDGETGLLVPSKDVAATSERLVTLLCDPELRARYSVAARAFVERDYNQRLLNRRLLDMYASLARGEGFGANVQ
jgi:colanic acid/amylovoran biosynthesis glycosyltransferase